MSRQERIEKLLSHALSPIFLAVVDESSNHSVRPGAQTHFKVTAVSKEFTGLKLIERHKRVNQLVKQEFTTGLHALSLHLYTPEEWDDTGESKQSPACKGGFAQG